MEQTIQQTGYSQRPMNARAQTFNRYLDSTAVYGVTDIVGINITDDITPTSNCSIIELTTFANQTGKLDRRISPDGGLIIPVDGSYIVSFQWIFYMQGTISEADIKTAYGTVPMVSLIGETAKVGDTITSFGFVRSQLFWTLSQGDTFTFSVSPVKGQVLYIMAANKWIGTTIPTYGLIYITKVS